MLLAAADAYKMHYLADLLNHTVADPVLTVGALEQAITNFAYENTDLRWLFAVCLVSL